DLAVSVQHLLEPALHPRKRFVTSDHSRRRISCADGGSKSDFVLLRFLSVWQRRPTRCDLTDKPVAPPMSRFDEAWTLRIIVQCLSQLANGHLENCFSDKSLRPDGS